MSAQPCRFCQAPLKTIFADLGMSPLANANPRPEDRLAGERFFPLCTYVCDACFLVQLPELAPPEEIFEADYPYFSSYSDTWLEHCRRYAGMAIERFGLSGDSHVVEVASNDGYLLQFFQQRGIPVLGIEPAGNVAAAAEEKGVPTLQRFFGSELAAELAAEGRPADLLVANNVLAHTPHLNDFVAGLARLLATEGVLTVEFPHLLRLIQEGQFDTIYHEHFSYFSLTTVRRIFAAHGLEVFDVEELTTHGGSLRIYGRRSGSGGGVGERVEELLQREAGAGLGSPEVYASFGARVRASKRNLLRFLLRQKEAGKAIAGYGAPAKGNTFLNYCGIGTDFLDYTVDRNPHKQGRLLPGSGVPIYPPEHLRQTRPDLVWILPWNLRREIAEQTRCIGEWGGRHFVAIPEVRLL